MYKYIYICIYIYIIYRLYIYIYTVYKVKIYTLKMAEIMTQCVHNVNKNNVIKQLYFTLGATATLAWICLNCG